MLDELKALGAEDHPVLYIATAQSFEDLIFQHIRKICVSRGIRNGEEFVYENLILSHASQDNEWVSIRQAPDEGDNRVILLNMDQPNGACVVVSTTDQQWMGLILFGLTPRSAA